MKKSHGFARSMILSAALLGAYGTCRAQVTPPGPAPFSGLGTGTLTANWTAALDPDTTGYEAQLSTSPNYYGTVLSSATLNLYAAFSGLAANTIYFAQVRVQDPLANFTDLGFTATWAKAPAAAPFSGLSSSGLTTNWTANGNPAGTSYAVQLSTAFNFTGTVLTSVTLNTSAAFTGLGSNTTYYMQVRAVNYDGAPTAYVPLGSALTLAAMPGPAAASGLALDALTANWTPNGNSGGTAYEAWLSTASDFTGTVQTSATLNTSAVFTTLAINTTYYLQVRAVNAVGLPTAYAPLAPAATLADAPAASTATLVQAAALTANWLQGLNPPGTFFEASASNNAGFAPGTVSTVTTSDTWATFTGLSAGTPYYLRVRALNYGGIGSAFVPLARTSTQVSAPSAGGTPDLVNYSNYANSALPVVVNGVVTGGIRKFVDTLPGLGAANHNNLGQYIPVATPDQATYAGADYYQLAVVDFYQQLHSNLPPTKLRGYKDIGPGSDGQPHYLGPLIIARRDRPVRLKLTNQLAPGGSLFLPVDTSIMGAGRGPDITSTDFYPQNRSVIHLHGGDSPWISDGTPHQWITPAGEPSIYKKGAAQQNVPDMPNPGEGSATYYWPNQQSSRLMWFHDHVHGLTRLNAYAGEAAAYLITDPAEDALIAAPGALPNLGGVYKYGVPLIIQDKSFVPPLPQLAQQDPTWDVSKWGGPGSLWFPHVYVPVQTPAAGPDNPLGRWDYGPWLNLTPVVNPLPNPSAVPEAFLDTPLVNGAAYPVMPVTRRAYRFRILNASNDRTMNLQLYYADPANPTEVRMVPAVFVSTYPAGWPADGRPEGVPDPALAGPQIIQIGTEAGFLPAPVVMDNQPMVLDSTGNVAAQTLLLSPAERADIVVDFSNVPSGSKLILYNDALAPAPGGDLRYDYYTGGPDQTPAGGAPSTLPGYGPNMRTIMQFQVSGPQDTSFSLGALTTALAAAYGASEAHPVADGVTADGATDVVTPGNGTPGTVAVQRKTMDETFDPDYGRLQSGLGVQAPDGSNVKFGYADPVTEFVKDGELQVWRLKNYTGDIHPVHFHLFNVQLLNRVEVDGSVIPLRPEEKGWKETVRVNPQQDVVVALRPKVSVVPFALPDSVRLLDPTAPPNSSISFKNLTPLGGSYTVYNSTFNFGHEYTWHCHILGHEENDFMRPMTLLAAPEKPTNIRVIPGYSSALVSFDAPPTGGSAITGYTVTANPGGIIATGASSPILVGGLTNGVTYTLDVKAANAVGPSLASLPSGLITPDSVPQAAAYTGVGTAALTANWTDVGLIDTDTYSAELSTAPDFTGALVSSQTLNKFAVFTALSPNTTYYGRVNVIAPDVSAFRPLGPVVTLAEAPVAASPELIQAAALTAAWQPGADPDGTLYEAALSNNSGFAPGTVSTVTTTSPWATFSGLNAGTMYYTRVRAVNYAGVPSAFTPLANTLTQVSFPPAGGTPDYVNYSNYANSALPVVVNGVVTGGIRKFVDTLPGLGAANQNNLHQYIPIAVKDQTTYSDADYYQLAVVDFTQQMHSDLPPTKLRGYKDLAGDGQGHYLGPLIIAQRGRPVRLKFTNLLPTGTAGDLFIPTDTSIMGAGPGPAGGVYTQNRAVIHLHGGDSPWISDGTPHQWITPAGEPSIYKKGAAQQNVPDMSNPGEGSATYFWPNQQSSRLMWYHDHTHGLTRLNAYAGEAAAYLITDAAEDALIATPGALPDLGGVYHYGVPLIIQDKSFVPPLPQLNQQDPTWDTAKWGGPGSLWFPHVYVPNQTSVASVANPLGRWDYGPWDPANTLHIDHVPSGVIPVVPNPSGVPEAFMDTPLVNGAAYPVMPVTRRAYRFRVLNGANDRTMNLQLYYADPANPTELKMVPAADGRPGGVPDPATAGPKIIQIGTEAGFLPAPVVMDNQPIVLDSTGNIITHTLLLAPAERADIVVDFSQVPNGSKIILYNDALAPAPGGDPRYDYYTGCPDQTLSGGAPSTLAGYGPNMHTIMQFAVSGAQDGSFNLAALQAALPAAYGASETHPVPAGVTAGDADETRSFTPAGGTPGTFTVQRKTMDETYSSDYGRLQSGLGVQVAQSPAALNVKYGYADPVTEFVKDGELQIWRLKNYTGDIHPVHFHMFNVQVLNRVDLGGAILPPDPEEKGWKETVRANPQQDVVVALRPKVSVVPFALPDSVRLLDPTAPPNSSISFKNLTPLGVPYTVYNSTFNFGHEYTWHCHILGHEENDFMRPMTLLAAPEAPTGIFAEGGNGAALVSFNEPPNGGSPITGYTVTVRPGGRLVTGAGSPITVAGLTNDATYTFTVTAANSLGAGRVSVPSLVVTPDSIPQASPYTGISSYSVTANWTEVGFIDTDTYHVQLSTAADFTGTVISSETLNDFATFAGLKPGTTYFAQIRIILPTVTGFRALGPVVTLPSVTELFPSLTAVSSTTFNATWTGDSGAGYTFRLARNNGTGTLVSSGTLTGTVKSLNGLLGGTSYYFEVRLSTEADASYAYNRVSAWTLPTVTPLLPNVETSSTTLRGSWRGAAGSSYIVALSLVGDFATTVSSGPQTGLSKTYTGLTSNTKYFFRVKLSTEADASYAPNTVAEETLASLTLLSPSLVSASSTTMSAAWNGDAASDYVRVFAADSAFTALLSSETQTGTGAAFNELAGGTTYYFKVKLSTEADGAYRYNTASGRTLPTVTTLSPWLSDASSRTITVSWNGRADTGYVTVLGLGSGFGTLVSSSTQAGNSRTFTGLSSATAYSFEVKLSTEADASYAPNVLAMRTLAPVTPLWPASVSVSSSSIRMAWTNIQGANYIAVLSGSAGFSPVISSGSLTAATALFTGLSKDSPYYFEVKLSTEADASYAANHVAVRTLQSFTGLDPRLAALSTSTLTAYWAATPGMRYVAVLAADIDYTTIISSSVEIFSPKTYSGLAGNSVYYYAVKVATEPDTAYGLNAISGITLPPVTELKPSLVATSSASVYAGWSGAAGMNFRAELSLDSGFGSTVYSGVVTGSGRSFTGLAADTEYYFRVRVATEPSVSFLVNRVSARTLQPATALAPALTAGSPETLAASWTAVAGSTYVVVLAADSGYTDVRSSVTQTGNSRLFTDLENYTTYYLQVKLVTERDNAYGYNQVSKRTLAEPLTVTKISPDKAIWGPDGLSVTVNGTGFTRDCAVKLARSGQDDFDAPNVTVVSRTLMKANWPTKPAARAIRGKAARPQAVNGVWNVVVTGGGQSVTLADALAVLDTAPNSAKVFKGIFNPVKGEAAQLTSNLPAAGEVSITVYDSQGRKIVRIFKGDRTAGDYLDAWDGRNEEGSMCASGVYLIRFDCPGFSATKRVVLVK